MYLFNLFLKVNLYNDTHISFLNFLIKKNNYLVHELKYKVQQSKHYYFILKLYFNNA